ncbi:hypothetical protein JAAARDRAFT_199477 [Jaapia argillacea MUCL 33604]|uniref:Uncharacterized protein n=1 Tax=Jaapia argillacea MUCL 33604 TaxID=933084 RepID=A0A067PB91_9AGAM|nr:hypothetical protein JAAARDRAFT_199477 [Jaapia argillacea MUCL 33604]
MSHPSTDVNLDNALLALTFARDVLTKLLVDAPLPAESSAKYIQVNAILAELGNLPTLTVAPSKTTKNTASSLLAAEATSKLAQHLASSYATRLPLTDAEVQDMLHGVGNPTCLLAESRHYTVSTLLDISTKTAASKTYTFTVIDKINAIKYAQDWNQSTKSQKMKHFQAEFKKLHPSEFNSLSDDASTAKLLKMKTRKALARLYSQFGAFIILDPAWSETDLKDSWFSRFLKATNLVSVILPPLALLEFQPAIYQLLGILLSQLAGESIAAHVSGFLEDTKDDLFSYDAAHNTKLEEEQASDPEDSEDSSDEENEDDEDDEDEY